MPLVKQKLKPGFDSLSTQTENASGWFDGNLLRWRLGHLEKYPGWQRLINQNCGEHVRVMHAWEDLDQNLNLALGTDGGPLLLVNTTLFTMTTTSGFLLTLTVANSSFSVLAGSALVTAHIPGANAQIGGVVTTQQKLSIGGIIIPSGTVMLVSCVFPGGFSFNMPSVALYSESTTGAAVFSFTVIGNTTTVTLKNHGLAVG